MREDEGGVIPQGLPIPKVATCCTESESAKWTTISQQDQQEQDARTSHVTTPAHRRVPGKPGATTLTAYAILQSINRTRIAETQSKS